MSQYQNNPFQRPALVQKGVPTYLFGGFNSLVGNTNLYVTNTALTSNVATVTVQIVNGPLPAVGNLISIINSTNSSGLFNVNRAVITGVTISQTTGAGTITFALTNANVTSAADQGSVIIEPNETSESLANNSYSVACLIQAPEGDSQFTLPISVTFPTLPTAATVTLQASLTGNAAEFTPVGSPVAVVASSAQTVGPFNQVTLQRGYLYRLAVTGLSGSGTIVAKIGG